METQILDVKPSVRKSIISLPISDNSYGLRANIGYYIPNKRISLLSGVGYKNINHVIGGVVEVTYSEENVTPNLDGVLPIAYDVPFYTAFGNVDLNVLLLANPNQQNFEEGDDVLMHISLKHNVRWLYIPISIEYDVIDRKKLDVFVKAGSLLNFVQDRSISRKQLSISNLYIRIGATDIFHSIPQAKITDSSIKFIPEVFIGGGLRLQVAPHLFVLGSLEFLTTPRPFYENSMLTTSFNSIGFSIGGMYRL